MHGEPRSGRSNLARLGHDRRALPWRKCVTAWYRGILCRRPVTVIGDALMPPIERSRCLTKGQMHRPPGFAAMYRQKTPPSNG